MKKDPKILINHILESIDTIEKYTNGISMEQFMEDSEKQDAVIRRLEIIGEAVASLENEFKQDYPQVPWGYISGMRNRLIHEYFRVDLSLVWEVVKTDILELKKNILTF